MNNVRKYSLEKLQIQGGMRWEDLIVVKYLMDITVHYSFMLKTKNCQSFQIKAHNE